MLVCILSLLISLSIIGPVPVLAGGGGAGAEADLTAAIAKTVAWYQEQHPSPGNWEGLPALWGAGEDLNAEPWLATQGWRETDPGFAADASTNDHLYYIFRLLAVGENPASAWSGRNLFAELAAQQTEVGAFGNLGKHLWAMVALDVGKELDVDLGGWDEDSRQKAVDYLLSQQNQDGSFGSFSQLDYTGWSLTALSNYRGDPGVETAISRAIDYLRSKQQDNAGFDMGGQWGEENPNSNAAVLSGLVAVGENVLASEGGWVKDGTTILDALLKYQQEDGSFWYKEDSAGAVKASTVQSLMALVDLKHGESTRHRMGKEIQFAPGAEPVAVTVCLAVEGRADTILPATKIEVQPTAGAPPTALDALEQGLIASGISYDLQHYDWGILVRSIAGEENGFLGGWDGWSYTANGISPDVGAADYTVAVDDAILFYYSRWAAISTASVIEPGDENPAVEIDLAGDEYAASEQVEDAENWVIDTGETGLTVDSITKNDAQRATIAFTGIVADGTISIQAGVSALVGDAASNELLLKIEPAIIVPVAHVVTFNVTGKNGTLTAIVDGTPISSGENVEKGKTVVFTATPAEGYQVKEWTLAGQAVADNKTNTLTLENLASATTATVEFAAIPGSGGDPGGGGYNIVVTFKLIGDNKNIWVPTTSVTVPQSSTAFYLFDKVLRDKGLVYEDKDNYIAGIQAPAFFGGDFLCQYDNGPMSGWLYLVNGQELSVALDEYELEGGDAFVFYYTDDFTQPVCADVSYTAEGAITGIAIIKDGSSGWGAEPQVIFADGIFAVPLTVTEFTFRDGNQEMKASFVFTGDNWNFKKVESSGPGTGSSTGQPTGGFVVAPKVTVANGKSEIIFNQSDMSAIIAEAKENKQSTIIITPEITGEAQKVSVQLPGSSISSMATDEHVALKVETPAGIITIPQEALMAIASQVSNATVTVSLESVDRSALTPAQQAMVGEKPVYDITIKSGSSHISSFDGNNITISLPYTLQKNEKAADVRVWYLNNAGNLKQIACTYDENTSLATFKTSHLSYYLVGVETGEEKEKDGFSMNFGDVKEGHWYYEAVKYAVENGLFVGTGETIFSPNEPMTRAMLVTVLYRLEDTPAVTGINNFSDVKNSGWYTNAVIWANVNGIVSGCGNSLFKPDDPITREQLASIFYRYAAYKGYALTAVASLNDYTDTAKISNWAKDAMSWANAKRLITGRTATTLVPKGSATRAEVASILQQFKEGFMK